MAIYASGGGGQFRWTINSLRVQFSLGDFTFFLATIVFFEFVSCSESFFFRTGNKPVSYLGRGQNQVYIPDPFGSKSRTHYNQ